VRAAVALINPKNPPNVGNVLRACSNFGAERLHWTPERIVDPEDWPEGQRLPREERMKLYTDVSINTIQRNLIVTSFVASGFTPVAVEVRESAELLPTFEHPKDAVYVFGPEDGSLDRGILTACHRFIVIPSTSCLNLAAAVNVVLYDRLAKMHSGFVPHGTRAYAGVEG
jgi:tRNA(Leu) C34 or U34 (ribose-2'-O)-methylase TrmL